jgi:hypothetical protein
MHEIEEAALKWAENEKVRRRKNTYSKLSKDRFIYDAVSWFKMLGCLIKEPVSPIPFQKYRDKYLKYITQEQGLSEETAYNRSYVLRDFLININALVCISSKVILKVC